MSGQWAPSSRIEAAVCRIEGKKESGWACIDRQRAARYAAALPFVPAHAPALAAIRGQPVRDGAEVGRDDFTKLQRPSSCLAGARRSL
jgi:hypothetical protein